MKVLFCSNEAFLPVTVGGSIENVKIVECLAKRGHEVVVATPLFVRKKPIEEKYGIKLEPFSPFKMSKFMKLREIFYALYSFLYIFHLMRLFGKYRFDAVFIQNCLLGFSGIPFRRRYKTVFFLGMTDFLSGFLYHYPYMPRRITDILVSLEKWICRQYEHILVITPRMKKELINFGHEPDKLKVVYIGVDTNIFNPDNIVMEDKARLRKDLGVKGKIVLFHGTVQPDAVSLFKRIFEFQNYVQEVTFLVVGAGAGYEKLCKELKRRNVIYKTAVSHHELAYYVAISDAGIIPYRKTFNSDIILTSKILEYLSFGIPVVCSQLEGIKEIFGNYDFVKMVVNEDDFPREINRVLDNGKSQEAIGLIRKNFSWDRITADISEEMEKNAAAK